MRAKRHTWLKIECFPRVRFGGCLSIVGGKYMGRTIFVFREKGLAAMTPLVSGDEGVGFCDRVILSWLGCFRRQQQYGVVSWAEGGMTSAPG